VAISVICGSRRRSLQNPGSRNRSPAPVSKCCVETSKSTRLAGTPCRGGGQRLSPSWLGIDRQAALECGVGGRFDTDFGQYPFGVDLAPARTFATCQSHGFSGRPGCVRRPHRSTEIRRSLFMGAGIAASVRCTRRVGGAGEARVLIAQLPPSGQQPPGGSTSCGRAQQQHRCAVSRRTSTER
jgi:hypothetical protein